MKNILLYILLGLLASIGLWSCDDNDEPAPPTTPRTVLVYMVANNSLNGYDSFDLNEMQQAARQGDLGASRLIVYHHSMTNEPSLREITKSGVKLLKKYDTATSSMESKRMLEVVSDMKSLAPANNYGLILWSHGQGWLQNGVDEGSSRGQADDTLATPLSFGVDGTKKMNITTLAKTLEGSGFDYVYFDCCFMMGIEVVYQMRNVAPAIAGSVIELPANGMPYDKNLRYLMPESVDLIAAARSTFDEYNKLTGIQRTCAMSVIKTDKLSQLASLTKQIYSAGNPVSKDFNPQKFMLPNLYVGGQCYLFDFAQYIREKAADDTALLALWESALNEAVEYAAATPKLWNNIEINHHCGLSTYILNKPADADYNGYRELDWYKDVAQWVFADNQE